MAKYRVKPGYRHGVGKMYGPGDVIEMTPHEAAGFLDKLEPVADDKVEDEAAPNGAEWVSYENPTNSPSVVLPEAEVEAETDADSEELASNEADSSEPVSTLVVNPKRGRGRPRKTPTEVGAEEG